MCSTSSAGHHLRKKGICCFPITCKNWEKELSVMLFITHDVVKLSEIIIIPDRFDNSFDTQTQVLFCFQEIWNDKSTHCQFMVLPLYSDLFTYCCCQWAKHWGTTVRVTLEIGEDWDLLENKSGMPSAPFTRSSPSSPLHFNITLQQEGFCYQQRNLVRKRSSISGSAPRCWQGTLYRLKLGIVTRIWHLQQSPFKIC